MKLTVYLADDSVLNIADFDPNSALDIAEGLEERRFATFAMDDATVIVNRDHIVRLDLDYTNPTPANPQRDTARETDQPEEGK